MAQLEGMSVRVALVSLLLVSGCTLTKVSGMGNRADLTESASSAGGGSSSIGPGTTGGSGGQTGQSTGSSGGSSTAVSTGSSGGLGSTGTGSGGSSTGCLPIGTVCGSNAACCTESCDETCGQAAGQTCLSDADCSSANCKDKVCACSTWQAGNGGCATDADCCNGVSCTHKVYGPKQYGQCCSQVGGVCQGTFDCCDENCNNGHCDCLPQGPGGCQADTDCCTGKCINDVGQGTFCLNGPGEECDGGADCYTNACLDGACGACSALSGFCSTDQACCSGLTCAGSFQEFEQSGAQHDLVDAGAKCCGATGASCQDGGDCCSQTCTDSECTCATTTEKCFDDQSCCSGGACHLPLQANDEFGTPICCQALSQFCVAGVDCCSGKCVNQACACVASGGQCGLAGLVAPDGPQACCSGGCNEDAGTCW
jgi:hypothetical protein